MIGFGKAVGDILHVCVPLTPTANETKRWNRWQWSKHGEVYRTAIAAASCGLTWSAPSALIAYVRCGDGNRAADPDNVIIGCKAALDAIVRAGILPDDRPAHVEIDRVVSLPRVGWSERFGGPATHLVLARWFPDVLSIKSRENAAAILRRYLSGEAVSWM